MNQISDVIICSFYSNDDYYRGWAEKLRKNLDSLDVMYELLEIEKQQGEDWADVTRRKVGFLARVCEQNPDKKVFWIDVDCSLHAFPDYIRNFTADIIGFQRSFGSPMQMGYARRTRFWEPCFWGINTTPNARKMIADAYEFEQLATEVKATDDYFMEEAWRENADNLSFQLIPSNAIIGKGISDDSSKQAFFQFGSSGNVKEFKGKVAQHGKGKALTRKEQLLVKAKKLEEALPERLRNRARQVVDASGLTGLLTGSSTPSLHPVQDEAMKKVVRTSQISGAGRKTEELIREFEKSFRPRPAERNSIEASRTYAYYANRPSNESLKLIWWHRPFPGNFGDWLSPLIFSAHTEKRIIFQHVTSVAVRKHLISLGSIGRFIKSNSVVVGTGISTDKISLNSKATYISLRGPITANVLKKSGGPDVELFGDPGLIISRVIPIERNKTNGRTAFIRHFSHKQIPVVLNDNMDELDVLMSHPDSIKYFAKRLNEYDKVVTSAMHVFITCQSYGIPCALITFEGFESQINGNSIKYADYALGAGLERIDPVPVGLNLKNFDFDNIMRDDRVSEAKKDEVELAIKLGLEKFKK